MDHPYHAHLTDVTYRTRYPLLTGGCRVQGTAPERTSPACFFERHSQSMVSLPCKEALVTLLHPRICIICKYIGFIICNLSGYGKFIPPF